MSLPPAATAPPDAPLLLGDDLLEVATDRERDAYARYLAEWDPETWLTALFPGYTAAPPAEHHREFWRWLWDIEPEMRPEAFVAIWPRGGAKSTSAELATVALAGRQIRRYGLYVCATQDQADDHVGNVAAMLESRQVERLYPDLAERRVGKYGNVRGWRRNRLWTADGFVLDAIGLDSAARGVKLDEQRPDLMVIDDIDRETDSPRVTARKIATLTRALIPAGSADLAVLAIQNLVHPDSVFARLADGRATFLSRRRVSGPIPALRGLAYTTIPTPDGGRRVTIAAGEPTWAGQDVAACQGLIDDIGQEAFDAECQHDVTDIKDALWSAAQIAAGRATRTPDGLTVVAVGVDPSGSDDHDTAAHDEIGIVVAGRVGDTRTGRGYLLEDRSCTGGPTTWGRAAVQTAFDWDADAIVGEVNYGGAMAKAVLETAMRDLSAELGVEIRIPVKVVTASRGKRQRAEPLAALYGDKDRPETWPAARFHHVGVFASLEREQTRWTPDSGTSPNRMDAAVWSGSYVMGLIDGTGRARSRYRGGRGEAA